MALIPSLESLPPPSSLADVGLRGRHFGLSASRFVRA
jgi:hypothetical protein